MTKRTRENPRPFTVTVPCSTANIGPGFDTLGVGLSMYLRLEVTFEGASGFTVSYEGDSPHTVPLDPQKNLVTRTAIQTAYSCGQLLPEDIHVKIINPIPLGRGLGSSGSAVVAGVVLANEACDLGMDTQRILDYCLKIEGHPDNITASILGGFVASYNREVSDPAPKYELSADFKEDYARRFPNVPAYDTPNLNIGRHLRLKISSKVKFVVTIPEFELQTKLARSVLPVEYPKGDVIFNIQRVAVLLSSLASEEVPDPAVIAEAMHDRVHQKYRQHLVPGLPEILKLSYKTMPGLLGVCVSGAGPTVLCLATDHFDTIGKAVCGIFGKHAVAEAANESNGLSYQNGSKGTAAGIKASYRILEVSENGFTVTY
ncbi:ribosomal protein S5 domain 2-type protein [Chytriomyces sp. MP71]|nr:ribosomal protein S5 domain 2-type protein [Chytriomyces sp. MP71]